MNVSMWLKALQVIPSISKEDWQQLDVISRWLIATRSAVLVITFISAAIAGILAYRDGQLNFWLWLVMTFGLIMAHATNNLVNDITDSWKGVDKGNDAFRSQYGPQPIEHGLMSVKEVMIYAAITGLAALACGVYLIVIRGGYTPFLVLLGVFFVLFYTWPLKHIGLGEFAVLLVWGPLMIGGGYYVITGSWNWVVVVAGLPYALGATSVIFGKHIDKIPGDKSKKIRTLPVLLGDKLSRQIGIGIFILQYILVLLLVLTGDFTPVLLIVFLAIRSLILAIRVFSEPKPDRPPPDYPEDGWPLWYVAFAFLHNRTFGFLFVLGLLIDALLVTTLLN